MTTPERRAALGIALRLVSQRAALFADQMEALERGDTARLRQLAELRAAVEAEFDALPEAEPVGDEPAGRGTERWVRAALQELEREWEAEEQLRNRLQELGESSLPLLRGLAQFRRTASDYVEPGLPGHSLDVRF